MAENLIGSSNIDLDYDDVGELLNVKQCGSVLIVSFTIEFYVGKN